MGPAGSRMSMLRLVLKGAKILIAKGREALSDQLSVSGVFGGPEAMYQLEDPAHSAGSQCKPSRPQQLGLFFFCWHGYKWDKCTAVCLTCWPWPGFCSVLPPGHSYGLALCRVAGNECPS